MTCLFRWKSASERLDVHLDEEYDWEEEGERSWRKGCCGWTASLSAIR